MSAITAQSETTVPQQLCHANGGDLRMLLFRNQHSSDERNMLVIPGVAIS